MNEKIVLEQNLIPSKFRGTRVVRTGSRTVRVFLDRNALAFLCQDESTKLIIGYSVEHQEVVVTSDFFQPTYPSKVFWNKDSSGRFSKTLSDEAMALIFPDPQVNLFVPSTLEFEKYDQAEYQARYVVFKRSDAALASSVDGGASSSVEQTEDVLTTGQELSNTV